jgi:ribosomal protein L11 methyltransferase
MQLPLRLDAEVHTDDDWRDAWKSFYCATVLGNDTLLLRPSWIERRTGDPTRELVLDPGRAFGTGLHATTRLCLDRICALFEASRAATDVSSPPRSILDLGCGSGILGLACARLFEHADPVVMVDSDPEATATTMENARVCGLVDRVDVDTGDVREVEQTRRFDLVLANIRPEVLTPAAASLAQRLRPGGRLTLSGILDHEADDVLEAYTRVGLVSDHTAHGGRRSLEGWTALDLARPEPAS